MKFPLSVVIVVGSIVSASISIAFHLSAGASFIVGLALAGVCVLVVED